MRLEVPHGVGQVLAEHYADTDAPGAADVVDITLAAIKQRLGVTP